MHCGDLVVLFCVMGNVVLVMRETLCYSNKLESPYTRLPVAGVSTHDDEDKVKACVWDTVLFFGPVYLQAGGMHRSEPLKCSVCITTLSAPHLGLRSPKGIAFARSTFFWYCILLIWVSTGRSLFGWPVSLLA